MRQALLEAAVLKDMGRKVEGSKLLWDHFARTLATEILRALPDFEDVDAEHKAMALALNHPEARLPCTSSWPDRASIWPPGSSFRGSAFGLDPIGISYRASLMRWHRIPR